MKNVQQKSRIQKLVIFTFLAISAASTFGQSANAQSFDFWDPWHARNEYYDPFDTYYDGRAAIYQSKRWIAYAFGGPSFPSGSYRAQRAYEYADTAFFFAYYAYLDVNAGDTSKNLDPLHTAWYWRIAADQADLSYRWLVSHMESTQDFSSRAREALLRCYIAKEYLNDAAELSYFYYEYNIDYQYPYLLSR